MEEKKLRLLDLQFAKFLAARTSFSAREKSRFHDVVCQLSLVMAAGDSCLALSKSNCALLERSGLTGIGNAPLVVWKNHLYLQRMFTHERELAQSLKALSLHTDSSDCDTALLDALFRTSADGEVDWQRRAAEQALAKRFLIISGGPGTGKTSTVVKILVLLLSTLGSNLRIALAAPTGKAAVRLQESISGSAARLQEIGDLAQAIPQEACTLHRLLGVRRFSPAFRYGCENPLPYDVVVVDEASMVDLALMAKLVAALRPQCRLVLLGDKNQLSSVESGAVLADLITALPGNTVELKKSYRFDVGIKGFAEAINSGSGNRAWGLIENAEPANVTRLTADVAEYGAAKYSAYMDAAQKAESEEEYKGLFPLLRSFKILCALRNGKTGVGGVNHGIEEALAAMGYDCFSIPWYRGRPVMVTRNNYALNLFNGDVGICMPDPENRDVMKVWFEGGGGELSAVLPGRLSSCETVFALTIHKSQGTEIDEVLVLLPEKPSELVTRELLYTAVTRAVNEVKLQCSQAAFTAAVSGKVERSSGLCEMVKGNEVMLK